MGGGGAEVWVSHPFPQHSSVRDSGPDAFLQPLLHQRGCSRGGHPGLNCQGCSGACSTSFSGLLQPSVRCVEDLGVVASGHRPLPPQSLCGCVPLSDGDHSVGSPVSSSGRLDGLHRLEGSVPPSAGSPGLSSLSTLFVQGSRFPVQSAVLWPLHGSTGLLSGHGSCFRHPPRYGDSHTQVSRRLASPVVLSGIPPPGSPDCPQPLPRVGDRGQPGEIPPRSIPGGAVSRGCHQHPDFHGFSVAGAHIQAAVNCRRISILRLASRELVALAAGHVFFAGSPGSWRQTADAVSPAVPPSFLGSCRSLGSGAFDGGVSQRPPVVAPPSSPLPRCVPLPGVSRPRLLVRRFGRRVGCTSGLTGRFRPLGLPPSAVVYKRQRTSGYSARSPPVSVVSARSHCGGLLRQRHGSSISPQGRGHQVSFAERHRSGDPALVGVSLHPSGSSIYPGLQQRPGGRSVTPAPAPSF